MGWNLTTRELHRKIERRDLAIEDLEQDLKLAQKDLEWHRKEMWAARKQVATRNRKIKEAQEILEVLEDHMEPGYSYALVIKLQGIMKGDSNE